MPLLATAFLMALGARSAPTEIPIGYRRPSAILKLLTDLGLNASFRAHDDRSTMEVAGTLAEVEAAREALRLLDAPRQAVRLCVTVASPLDHLTWEVDARLATGQSWKTADDETNSEVALTPMHAANDALTLRLVAHSHGTEIRTTLRLKRGEPQTVKLGQQHETDILLKLDAIPAVEERSLPLPAVTVRYVGG